MSDYTVNECENFNPQNENDICPAVGHQFISVCLPVEITPFAKVGAASITCKEEPKIQSGCTPCCGTKNGTCAFTISQTICVELPVFFGASTYVGDTYVDCLGRTCDSGCDDTCEDTCGSPCDDICDFNEEFCE